MATTLPLKLHIPEKHRGALALLLKLSDEAFDALSVALRDAPAAESSRGIISRIPHEIIPEPNEIPNLVAVLLSLALLPGVQDVPTADLVHAVCETAKTFDSSQFSDIDWEKAERRLGTLLTIDSLVAIGKASDVLSEHERFYCRSRVLTDIRPVFGHDPKVGPQAVGFIHVLKLTYHQNTLDDTADFYIAMTSESIARLRRALDRAVEKEDSLRRVLKEANVSIVDTSDHYG